VAGAASFDGERFVRQVLLSEIGVEGQARLGAVVAGVAGEGLAHDVAARYALAAGMDGVSPGAIELDHWAPTSVCEHEAARAVLAGARAALAALRSGVGLPAHAPRSEGPS